MRSNRNGGARLPQCSLHSIRVSGTVEDAAPDLTGHLHVTQGASPPPTSTRAPPSPNAPGLTAAAWNRRAHASRARGLEHWPRWLRMIPERERVDVLIRLFPALFLLLPGTALVASAHRHAHAATTAVVLFVVVHAALHTLAVWRGAASRPVPQLLRTLHTHEAAVMLAATARVIVVSGVAAGLSTTVCSVLLAGALCQLLSLRTAAQRLRHVLLALGSLLQFIAMALLTLGLRY